MVCFSAFTHCTFSEAHTFAEAINYKVYTGDRKKEVTDQDLEDAEDRNLIRIQLDDADELAMDIEMQWEIDREARANA